MYLIYRDLLGKKKRSSRQTLLSYIYVVYQKSIRTNRRLVQLCCTRSRSTSGTAITCTKTWSTSGTALSCTRGRSTFGTAFSCTKTRSTSGTAIDVPIDDWDNHSFMRVMYQNSICTRSWLWKWQSIQWTVLNMDVSQTDFQSEHII